MEQIQLSLRDGTILKYGGTGGRVVTPLMLDAGEGIVTVRQHWSNRGYGSRILVETSHGRRWKMEGGGQSSVGDWKIKVRADEGCEIVGLAFEGGMLHGAHVRSRKTGLVQALPAQLPPALIPFLPASLRASLRPVEETSADAAAPAAAAASAAEPATTTVRAASTDAAASAPTPATTALLPIQVGYAAGGVKLRPLLEWGSEPCGCMWMLHMINLVATAIVLLAGQGSVLFPYPIPLAIFVFFFTFVNHWHEAPAKMAALHAKTVNAPQLVTEAKLRAYVAAMQSGRVEIFFHVQCHHMHVTSHGKHGSSRERVVTHDAEYPLTYRTCTDRSSVAQDWAEDRSLDTGKGVALLQSGLTWECKTEEDTRRFKAAKKRVADANYHRDREMDVTVVARLPGFHAAQVYMSAPGTSDTSPWPLEILDWIWAILVPFGLTVPLMWYRASYYTRRFDHRVHKVITIA